MRHNFTSLKRRLASAGYRSDFVRRVLLPEWWDESCEHDTSLLEEIELRVARFLGLSLAMVKDPSTELSLPSYPARLRRIHNVDEKRLASAIHAAIQIAGATVRCMARPDLNSVRIPPDGLAWRDQIERNADRVSLGDVLSDLWTRGIPVVPIDVLPTPSFQGIACIAEGRPVILLGHKHDEPGRIAFIVAHESGHISSGDCEPGKPVVDHEGSIIDDSCIEESADRYATSVIVGQPQAPEVEGHDYRAIAQQAADLESQHGVDAGMIIYAWAAKTGNYLQASMATKALYRNVGARRLLRHHFESNINLNDASETDRALLRCVYGDSANDANAY